MKLYETRTAFIQNSLYSLYGLSNRTELGARPDLIKVNLRFHFKPSLYVMTFCTNDLCISTQLLTNLMRLHAKVFSIQLACSACLYNLTKSGLLDNDLFGIPSILMTEVAQLTLDAMERFPKHYQLQKNALLTLCNDRILQVTFCASLFLLLHWGGGRGQGNERLVVEDRYNFLVKLFDGRKLRFFSLRPLSDYKLQWMHSV